MKNKIFVCLLIAFFLGILLLSNVSAETLSKKYKFNGPIIEPLFIKDEIYYSVTIPGLESYSPVGEPKLPFKSIKLLLPNNAKINKVIIKTGNEKKIPGKYNVEITQPPIPLLPTEELKEKGFSLDFVEIKSEIKELEDYGERYSDSNVQKIVGYDILTLNLYPVKYNPKEGKLSYFESITVEVDYDVLLRKGVPTSFRDTKEDFDRVKAIVDNPSVVNTYPSRYAEKSIAGKIKSFFKTAEPVVINDLEQYDYVIITNQEFANLEGEYTFKTLADWKEQKGLKTKIVTTEYIFSNYNGKDEQEKIRNFIKYAYSNWNVQYVLLGGDADRDDAGGESGDNIVPVRKFSDEWGWGAGYMISDVYYSNLDGDFDYNGNGIYGEYGDGENGGEVDLYSEVYVGRAPVDSAEEIANFVRKTIVYENAVINEEDWLKNSLMVGEYLGFGGVSEYATNSKEEIKEGSDNYGYETKEFLSSVNMDTLYDNKWTEWEKDNITDKINHNEINEINHLGHANVNYVMKMYNEDIDGLTNEKPVFIYSQGCYPGSFDNAAAFSEGSFIDDNSLGVDSAAEHFTTNQNGAFAVIMNARFGWGAWDSTDGPSQRHDRRFFDALFSNVKQLGKANAYAKEGLIGYISSEDQFMKGIYFETNLLGDPETSIYVPPKPEHDVKVGQIKVEKAIVNKKTEINVSIKNSGLNDESDIVAELFVNGDFVENKKIGSIDVDEKKIVLFDYTFANARENEITIKVQPIEGEENTKNNELTENIDVSIVGFNDNYNDYGVDENGNGLYDSLVIDVGVDVAEEGNFGIAGILFSKKYDWIDVFWIETHLEKGNQNISLVFKGTRIWQSEKNGPYIFDLMIYNFDTQKIEDRRIEPYETKDYSWEDFEEAKDIGVNFVDQSYKKILNKLTTVGIKVYNFGIDLKEPVKLSLYENHPVEGWDYNLTLIAEKKIFALPKYKYFYVEFDWTPKEPGDDINLLVVANISDDVEPDNNIDYNWYEVSVPSRIYNLGQSDLSGYLLMKLQHLEQQGPYTLYENETIIVNGKTIYIEFISSGDVSLNVDGEIIYSLWEGDIQKLRDGSYIKIKDIFYNDYVNASNYVVFELEQWIDDRIVVNDLGVGNKRVIKSGENLDLGKMWDDLNITARFQENCVGDVNNFCDERVYGALLDENGKVMQQAEESSYYFLFPKFEAISEFWVYSEDNTMTLEEKNNFINTMKRNLINKIR